MGVTPPGVLLDCPRRGFFLLPVSTTAAFLMFCVPAHAEPEVMVVEEQLNPTDPGRTSASVTVIPVDEALAASDDVASVVESASGTVVRRLGGLGDYASVSIRGSSARQVQVFIDGVPLNPDGSAAINLSELPLGAFTQVEIYRGNAPPAFAAAPIGGVINLVTGDRTAPAAGTLSYGQLSTTRLTATTDQRGQVGGQDSAVLLFAESFSTQGDFQYFTDNATPYNVFDDSRPDRSNNDKVQLSTYGRWRLGGEQRRLTLSDAFLARDEGLPGHVNAPADAVRLQTIRNLATLQADGSFGTASWRGRLWQQLRQEVFDDRLGEIGTGTQWQQSRYATAGLLGSAAWAPRPWLVPSVTLTARQDRYTITDFLTEETESPRMRYVASGTLAADGWLLSEQLKLSPVVQAHYIDSRFLGDVPFSDIPISPDGEDTLTAITPRGGILLRLSRLQGLALKANAGRYLRPPDFTELFGDQGSIIGNTDLVPERGWQWDVGARLTIPDNSALSGSAEATWFSNSATDQIILLQNSQRTSIPTNLSATHTDGIEAALQLSVLNVLDSQSNLTWTRSENQTPRDDVLGKQLPRIPTREFHQRTSLHWKTAARVGHAFNYTDGNYWDAPNLLLASPRAIHGAFIRLGTDQISAEASALNLTNTVVTISDRNPLSDDDDTTVLQPVTDFIGYPLPGRTWLFTLTWSS